MQDRRCCSTMISELAALVLLRTVYLIQTAEVSHRISLTEVEIGGNVTLQCPVSGTEGNFFYWFKQSPGHEVQTVASVVFGQLTVGKQFSRFTVTIKDGQYFLTIRNVRKEDEATYFFQNSGTYLQNLVSVTFLAVNDGNHQKSLYVKQSPETESVQQGDPVTLQCSLLSSNKENADQCPAEHSVYWFRPGSGGSHPGVLYTHSEEERRCVHSLSTTIQNSSDTGTYYCAVVTCGQILFGPGTKVETRSDLDPAILVLGVLLACCLTVIAVLTFVVNRRKLCNHCKGALSSNHHLGHDRSTVGPSNDLDWEGKALNYAALNFSTRKVQRGQRRETPPECVYSAVRADYHNQLHPPL